MKVSKAKQLEALRDVVDYILSGDKEYEDYLNHCDENGEINPADITGPIQFSHVYAKTLVGLGLNFRRF